MTDLCNMARRGHRWLFVAFFVCVLPGSFVARAEEMPTRGEVVIFRGILGYWPRVDRFQNQLQQYGLASQTVFNFERSSVSQKIRRKVARDRRKAPSAIVGYSLGALSAIQLARDLEADGVHVPILVLIDPPVVSNIPSNVGRCVNLYKSHPVTNLVPEQVPIMRGVPVREWSPQTEVVNRDLGTDDLVFGPLYDNHLTIASTGTVQDDIAQTIASTVYGINANAPTRR